MGQSDADRIFHIRAIGVSTNSTERVGTFYFRAWSARVPLFQPRAYLGDAANAYANAATAVFDSVLDRLMCFAHVYKVRINLPISECCVATMCQRNVIIDHRIIGNCIKLCCSVESIIGF